ncbi:MAG: methyltransferase domain-containing protein [Oscillospiraceae bacterium]|nr:methyltransferase domain-containing protein [Oscillospiraceae bacterium]
MNAAYGPLAERYDLLTGDVPYDELCDWYETALTRSGRAVRTVLDLGCGTGALSVRLARRGYEMICVDASADMLSVFQQKLFTLPADVPAPMLLCQRAEELDLYDTVDGALCCLDGFNYFPPETLPAVLERLRLFISPGGTLSFDFLSPEHLRSLDGECFVDEGPDTLCLWRASLEDGALRYGVDLFRAAGKLWRRSQEEHTEYLHSPETLTARLEEAGFGRIELCADGPQHDRGRLFLTAIRL